MKLSALIDFSDDAREAIYDKDSLYKMVEKLHDMGCKRLYWYHYGDESYEFFWKNKVDHPLFTNCVDTIKNIPELNKTFVKYAKSFGMETVAAIKPYENGISMVFPEGSAGEAAAAILPHLDGSLPCMTAMVRMNPELRIKRRSWDIPVDIDSRVIGKIKLYKNDDAPTRIRKENIRILAADKNRDYKDIKVDFTFTESIETAKKDIISLRKKDDIITKKGDKVRVITLSGLALKAKYLAITTNFIEGGPDFLNIGTDMLEAYDIDGNLLPIATGIDYNIWIGEGLEGGPLKNGVGYDNGWGTDRVYLDDNSTKGDKGFIAFMRGKNKYLPTALCESEPRVKEYWLRMVRDCLEDGFDEIDFRIENHSTHTDEPFSFGYNQVILDEYRRKFGDAAEKDMDITKISQIRGDHYTDFLREANKLIKAAGRKMNVNLNVEFFRPDIPRDRYLAYPFNISYNWKQWLDELDLDAVTLRSFTFKPEFVLNDCIAREMIDMSKKKGLPIHYNRYMSNRTEEYVSEIEQVMLTGDFESIIIYEVAEFIKSDGNGGVVEKIPGFVDMVRRTAEKLNLI